MTGARLEEIARRRGSRVLLQFGSTVRGRTHPRSDVDLAALLDHPSDSLQERADLLRDLRSLFPEREVDLVLINRAGPLLLKKVTEAPRVLFGAPREVHELRRDAFRRCQDHGKYLDMERERVARVAGSATAG
jgi:predicted nucleotidyltransferase